MKKRVEYKFKKKIVYLVVFALILTNAFYYAFTHFEGISTYGDDYNYAYLASTLYNGKFILNSGFIFSVRLTEIFGIASFYYLFKVNNLSSSLFSILSYIGLIVVALLTVRLYYDDRTALTSAFLVSIFPLVTKYAVNINDDIVLAFIGSLAILLFLYGEKYNKKVFYFFSGVSLVVAWLSSYEAGIIIAFLLLYALVELLRKKISIDRSTVFFLYGIAMIFLVVFIFSYINSRSPFITITANLRFYSAVGTEVGGISTIPSSTTNLMEYINGMFQYNIAGPFLKQPIQKAVLNVGSMIFSIVNPYEYGLYFFFVVPMFLILLALREKRAYFLMSWFIFGLMFLEFGPMHIGFTLNPLGVTYLLAHKLLRFVLILTVPTCAIIGITLVKLLEFKNRYMLFLGVFFFVAILLILYLNNYYISNFWYYWQRYTQELVLQAVAFIKRLPSGSPVYLEGMYNASYPVFYSSLTIEGFLGNPSGNRVDYNVYSTTDCNMFANNSYIIWSGPPRCPDWTNVLNITTPTDIPKAVLQDEIPQTTYKITNIYYKR